MRTRAALATLAATALVLLAASPALASPTGGWTRVTGLEGVEAANTDEVGLQRTANGILHVAWTRKADALADTLLQSAISANGRSVTGPSPILSVPNTGINNSVDLVPGPGGGLRVLFAGLFPETEIDNVLATSTAPESSMTWTPPAAVSNTAMPSAVYVAAGIGASVSPVGTVASAWGDSGPGEGGYHIGLSPLDPDTHISSEANEFDPNIAFDTASGIGYVAWNDLPNAGAASLRVMPLAGGPEMTAPMSAAVWIGQRVSIAGRSGGGVYVGYGSGSNPYSAKPAWWRVGAPRANVVSGQMDARNTGLTAGPDGRLWLFWDRENRIFAARTNPAATKLGQIVSIEAPKGTSAIYRLNAEGSRGPLDLLALAEARGGLGYFHHRVMPGLSLANRPRTVRRGRKVTFLTKDAGMPVKGAKVTLKLGRTQLSRKTNGRGRVAITVPATTKPRRYRAIARKRGYSPARRTVRVRP